MNMHSFTRCAMNPLITPEMVQPWLEGYRVECTFNAGVAVYQDEILLLLRVAEKPPRAKEGFLNVPVLEKQGGSWHVQTLALDLNDPNYDFSDPRKVYDRRLGSYAFLTSISHLRLARSLDGIHFTVDREPFLFPDSECEGFGTEDPRITCLDGTWWINYTAVSRHGITTALASTRDFRHVERHGIAFVTENRDVTIFPDQIHGKYRALVRPVPRQIGAARIWIAESPDLLHWGGFAPLSIPSLWWSDARTGGGAVPIRTEDGWLVLYHGADRKSNRYSMGAALLDAEHPEHVLAVSQNPVLEPEADYETHGFYPNVVFSCGAILINGNVHMYYGAADRVIGLATAPLQKILDTMTPCPATGAV